MCWVSREVFHLLQYYCFEQFCFSLLSFMEITSFGILTTNGWEILFLICIFRVKYTFSLILLAYNQRTYVMEIV